MRVDLFDYALPEELIASRPPDERDGARLLMLARGGAATDREIVDLPALIEPGSLLVVNDTRVIPARLFAEKSSGGRVEIFLVEKLEGAGDVEKWRALARASKALRDDMRLRVSDAPTLSITIEGDRAEDGTIVVRLETSDSKSVADVVSRVGHVPLPPYMKRGDDARDRERYQTVFAKVPGAVAAPTAGLHLSERLLAALEARKVDVVAVTLHVSLGTFKPVTVDDLDRHDMHSERYAISDPVARAIAGARERGAPIVAVGTTVVRALESSARENAGHVVAGEGSTRLLIQPGYEFRVVDRLLTNFHLPKSTLLALVSAFAGRERILLAYAHAVRERYRFFSYGDAMLLDRATT